MPFPILIGPGGSMGGGGGGGGGPTSSDQVSHVPTELAVEGDTVKEQLDSIDTILSQQGVLNEGFVGAVSEDAPVIGQDGTHTVTAADAALFVSDGVLQSRINIILNDTPADPVVVTFPISELVTATGRIFPFKVHEEQTGAVSFVPAEGGVINGRAFDASPATLADGPGSLVTVTVEDNPGDAPVMSADGATRDAVTTNRPTTFAAAVTFTGSVSGVVRKRVLHPGCGGWSPRATNGAVLGSLQGSQTELSNRGFTFSQTTDQAIDRLVPFPSDLPGSASIKVSFLFSTTDTGGGNVVWNIQLRRMNLAEDWDSDSHTYSSFQKVATVAAPTTAGRHSLVSVTFSSSELDSAVAGEIVNFRIERDADTNVNQPVLVPEHSILIEEA